MPRFLVFNQSGGVKSFTKKSGATAFVSGLKTAGITKGIGIEKTTAKRTIDNTIVLKKRGNMLVLKRRRRRR